MQGNRTQKRRPFQAAAELDSLSSGAAGALKKLIAASRSSGTLNLANRRLQLVPEEVYQVESDGDNVKWWEVNELTKLDMSYNELKQLPAELWSLVALNTLLLSSNQLQQLPPGIEALEALKQLDLSENPLTSLPEQVADLPALASLSCNNCGLQQLPERLGEQQPQLSAVNVAGNQLTLLPAGLACAQALVVLNASKNQLVELRSDMLAAWASLRDLDVSSNQLTALPAAVGRLPRLSLLDVRSNQLSCLPPELGAASALVELKAGFNRLPDTLGMLVNMKTLDVRNNLLQELPDTLCGLQLVLLDLTNNSLRRLPPALGTMTSLRSMPLDGNALKLMRRELWSGPISALLQHLRDQLPEQASNTGGSTLSRHGSQNGSAAATSAAAAAAVAAAAAAAAADRPPRAGASASGGAGELILKGKGLTSIPAEVWQSAASLAKLDLSGNNLSAASALDPSSLASLTRLKVLCLNSCSLIAWPLAGVPAGALDSLHTLEVRSNPLQGVLGRGCLASCPALRSLDLSGVRGLQLAPDALQDTPQLEVLLASTAALQQFPAAVLACTGLRQLGLSSNSISSLPAEVTQLTRLSELDVSNNQLSSLPPQLGLLSGSLRVLQLEGNCLRTIRRPILDKGTAAVLDWLRNRIPV
uniref:Leucine-rich repeat-containing N-terminal plant-type domain-containing protein n=1 Tax=Tetradesmus obliquus TaxID=3088 RepID=A0A383W029_TETOB|eukprot:jgi/Sobl393_1/13139/SZX70499.1